MKFSIPAGILFLLLFAYQGILEAALYGRSPTTVALATQPIIALLLIAASLPIGFLLYQMYYVEYSPFSRLTGYVRRDRGADILRGLSPAEQLRIAQVLGVTLRLDVPTLEWTNLVPPRLRRCAPESLLKRHPWAWLKRWLEPLELESDDYRLDWIEAWMLHLQIVKSLLDIATMSVDGELKREYTNLSDIYHALGVARTVVWLAWISLIPLNFLVANERHDLSLHTVGFVLFMMLTAFVSALLWLTLHSARRRTSRTLAATVTLGLRWLINSRSLLDPSVQTLGRRNPNSRSQERSATNRVSADISNARLGD